MQTSSELLTFLPGIITAVAGLVAMMMAAFHVNVRSIATFSMVGVLAALGFSIQDLFGPAGQSFGGMVVFGGATSFATVVVLLATFFSILFTLDVLKDTSFNTGELYAMILFSTTGMIALAAANNLVLLFVGLETMSICLYVMAALYKNEKRGAEAGLKYFLLGAFSTGFLLYGIALLYGATGTLSIDGIVMAAEPSILFLAGTGLLLVGFLFKISAVPFHMWTPDVYQGTPTPLTGYMSTAAKTASVVALLLIASKVFFGQISEGVASAVSSQPSDALSEAIDRLVLGARGGVVLSVIAILTMVVGNLIALAQNNVKRMLAYSSIAHAGYLLVGIAAGNQTGQTGVLYYLFAYTVMNLGAFGVIAWFEKQKNLDFTEIENYSGLGETQPFMAGLLSVFLFSLAGIPPFAGFLGKYYVFAAAVESGLITLAVIGVLASATSVYYYLRVMVFMYFRPSHVSLDFPKPSRSISFALVLLGLLTLYYGVEPVVTSSSLFSLLNGAGY